MPPLVPGLVTSLAQLVGARGQLSAGETVTTVAPLFGALADLHASGVVHGHLAPGSVQFTADGRPMICDVGVAALLATPGTGTGTGGFVAPEVVEGAAPTSCSDVYAVGALGWFCLTGAPPGPAATRPLLSTLLPAAPPRLAVILAACLDADPARRPSAGAAAADVFDAAPAESVALTAVLDPAAEITRRIRSAAVPAAGRASRVPERRHPSRRVIAVVLGAFVALGLGATWFTLREPAAATQEMAGSKSHPPVNRSGTSTSLPMHSTFAGPPTGIAPTGIAPTGVAAPRRAASGRVASGVAPKAEEHPKSTAAASGKPSPVATEVLTASGSPRLAPAQLLQALVDARALAYVARSAPLLDLVYAAEAPKAEVDRVNIATALKNGGTYLGLSFVIKDVEFLTGTTDIARIRATIVTPAYRTGQLDGRKISHPPETLGPCTFTLRLTPDGWRVLALSSP